jgi:hypothetical protein
MPLDFDTLARVYNQSKGGEATVKEAYESVGAKYPLPGTLKEYEEGVAKVTALVKGGSRWPAAIGSLTDKPDLRVVQGGVKPAKKAKKAKKARK